MYTSEEQLAKMCMDELRDLASKTVTHVNLDDPDLERMTLLRAIMASSVQVKPV